MNSLYLIIFFISMGNTVINPLIGPLIFSPEGFFPGETLDYKTQAYAFLMGTYAIGVIIGNPVWGMLSDKIGGKKAILLALLGSIIASLLGVISLVYAIFLFLLIGRCLDGLMAGRRTVALSIISQLSSDKITSFRTSELCNAMGLLLGPIISGILVNIPEHNGVVPLYYYTGPLLLMLAASLINIILVLKDVKHSPRYRAPQSTTTFFNLKLSTLYISFFILQLGWFLYMLSIVPYIIVYWEFTPLDVGVFCSSLVLLYIIMLTALVPLLRKITSDRRLSHVSLIIGASTMILLSICSDHFYTFLACNIGIIITMAINVPYFMAKIAHLKNAEEQGKVIGIQNSIIGFSWLLASIMIGMSAGSALGFIFIFSGLLFALVSASLCLRNRLI